MDSFTTTATKKVEDVVLPPVNEDGGNGSSGSCVVCKEDTSLPPVNEDGGNGSSGSCRLFSGLQSEDDVVLDMDDLHLSDACSDHPFHDSYVSVKECGPGLRACFGYTPPFSGSDFIQGPTRSRGNHASPTIYISPDFSFFMCATRPLQWPINARLACHRGSESRASTPTDSSVVVTQRPPRI
ncbi:hypothetical protein B0H19DRAFT_1260182 [Mycena capillaripes]|nr:hypothetical protein B0H19DRAFT_1260182 [Mycena capillaripes]